MSEVCVTNPTSDLIAVHRRQKRRERILMNSGQRINTILSGPGGRANHLESSSANGSLSPSCELLEYSSSLEELGITYTPRPWYSFAQEHRCRACFAIGVILRMMVALSLLSNVVLPWTLCCVIFDFVTAARSKTKYPARGLFLNGLLYFGIDENFVIRVGSFCAMQKFMPGYCAYCIVHFMLSTDCSPDIFSGFVLERIWNFVRDSLFAAFAFLTAHAILYFVSLLYHMC
ncbi:unnamed protein product [Toxocara canis]|uniref:Uncharacterized protein n=1 Tax=Toxocara canis TaxID=6265 RepID=A0A183TXC8_TOXCA|nr:unnamed protein product [Toxocara canis]